MSTDPSRREIIARYSTADGEIQLQRRPLSDGSVALEIIANGTFLMASYNQVSERALASHIFETINPNLYAESPILIGGLGMGFTLQEALAHPVTAVDVVEMSPHIIAWNQTHFASINGQVLADPRVTLIQDDLYRVLSSASSASYSIILLDVDNGPSWLVYETNARLYTSAALEQWSALLRPGGAFAVWAAQPEPEFMKRLKTVFVDTAEILVVVPSDRDEPPENFIYYGLKGVP